MLYQNDKKRKVKSIHYWMFMVISFQIF